MSAAVGCRPDRPEDWAAAARMLRELLAACRPYERAERETARRLEGAAATLDAMARGDRG